VSAVPNLVNARPLVAVVGNPNTGKTTLFNRLTGQQARVANYPGVTVDRRSGTLRLPSPDRDKGDRTITEVEVLDVPGAYSMSARSGEEQIAINAVMGLEGYEAPSLVVLVLDATQLSRNLYLAIQIAELDVPMVVALNMIDEVKDHPPDHRSLSRLLGVPCVPTSAREGDGIGELKTLIARALREPARSKVVLPYPPSLLADAQRVVEKLPDGWRGSDRRNLALALWCLSSIEEDDELHAIPAALRAATRDALSKSGDRDVDEEIVTTRYAFIDAHLGELTKPPQPRSLTERLDRVFLHPIFGFAIFLLVMLVVFQSLFSWADPAIHAIEALMAWLGAMVSKVLPAGFLNDLLVQGVIAGVGSVLVFLPQILLLFFFIGLLENSGYMARAAYLMDRIMRSLGLHGRAFVPMLSGYACAIPAIMATRTMERQRDRLLTMMVVPLMSCSARLPVYTLIIAALFPPSAFFHGAPVQGLLMVAMYLFSTGIALLAAGVLGRTILKGRRVPFLLELPPYRWPSLRVTLREMWERARVFLTEAGTVILGCTLVLWALLSYPKVPIPPNAVVTPEEVSAYELQHSYAGQLGKAIEPAIRPLGFDWKIGVGIVGAFAAREVFVSTMGLVYGVGQDADETNVSLRDKLRAETRADGRPAYTPLVGLSLMIFFALACQCMSTLAVVKRETKGWRWPAFLFVYMTTLAWCVSFAVYQGGKLLGFAG
jgi:ferrous iron transport protein B